MFSACFEVVSAMSTAHWRRTIWMLKLQSLIGASVAYIPLLITLLQSYSTVSIHIFNRLICKRQTSNTTRPYLIYSYCFRWSTDFHCLWQCQLAITSVNSSMRHFWKTKNFCTKIDWTKLVCIFHMAFAVFSHFLIRFESKIQYFCRLSVYMRGGKIKWNGDI